jgi:hypothetical protein
MTLSEKRKPLNDFHLEGFFRTLELPLRVKVEHVYEFIDSSIKSSAAGDFPSSVSFSTRTIQSEDSFGVSYSYLLSLLVGFNMVTNVCFDRNERTFFYNALLMAVKDPNPLAVILDVLNELQECWIRRPAFVFYVNELEKLCSMIEFDLGFKTLEELQPMDSFQLVDELADLGTAVSDIVMEPPKAPPQVQNLADVGVAVSNITYFVPNLTIIDTDFLKTFGESKVMKGEGQVKIPLFLDEIMKHWILIMQATNHDYIVVQLESLLLMKRYSDSDQAMKSENYDPGDNPWKISGGRTFISPFDRGSLGIYIKKAWAIPPERRKSPNKRFLFNRKLMKQDYKLPVLASGWLDHHLHFGRIP